MTRYFDDAGRAAQTPRYPPTGGLFGPTAAPPRFRHLTERPPSVRGSDTSAAAAQAIAPHAGALATKVLNAIAAAGAAGLTDEEGANTLGMAGNSYRPRRRELEQSGRIKKTGNKRPTASGSMAVVWGVAEIGGAG